MRFNDVALGAEAVQRPVGGVMMSPTRLDANKPSGSEKIGQTVRTAAVARDEKSRRPLAARYARHHGTGALGAREQRGHRW
jgi:hypothetical protein